MTSRSPNNWLQRTVMDRVARYEGQRAAAEPERFAIPVGRSTLVQVFGWTLRKA
jgi:hypothetical protein